MFAKWSFGALQSQKMLAGSRGEMGVEELGGDGIKLLRGRGGTLIIGLKASYKRSILSEVRFEKVDVVRCGRLRSDCGGERKGVCGEVEGGNRG